MQCGSDAHCQNSSVNGPLTASPLEIKGKSQRVSLYIFQSMHIIDLILCTDLKASVILEKMPILRM